MEKRNDTQLKILEPEMVKMKMEGKTKREIAEHFGVTTEQVKDLLKRYRRRERKVAAGITPTPVGRPRKGTVWLALRDICPTERSKPASQKWSRDFFYYLVN